MGNPSRRPCEDGERSWRTGEASIQQHRNRTRRQRRDNPPQSNRRPTRSRPVICVTLTVSLTDTRSIGQAHFVSKAASCPSVITRQQSGNRTTCTVLDEPKVFGLHRVLKYLQVVEAIVFVRSILENSQALQDHISTI